MAVALAAAPPAMTCRARCVAPVHSLTKAAQDSQTPDASSRNRQSRSAWGQAIYIRDPDDQLIEIVTMAWREKLPPIPV